MAQRPVRVLGACWPLRQQWLPSSVQCGGTTPRFLHAVLARVGCGALSLAGRRLARRGLAARSPRAGGSGQASRPARALGQDRARRRLVWRAATRRRSVLRPPGQKSLRAARPPLPLPRRPGAALALPPAPARPRAWQQQASVFDPGARLASSAERTGLAGRHGKYCDRHARTVAHRSTAGPAPPATGTGRSGKRRWPACQ